MLTLPTRRTLALLAVAALPLSACSGTADEPPATPLARATTTPTPTPSPTPTPTAPLELGTPAELTPEDTILARADEAVLQKSTGFDPAGEYSTEAQWASRVVDVTPADPADFAVVQLDAATFDPATQQAFYVRTTHRLLWARGNSPLTSVNPPHVIGWTTDGTGAGDLLVMGLFAPCQTLSQETPAVGLEVAACTIAVLPAGQALGYVGVQGNPEVSLDAHETPTSSPVVWRLDG